MRSTNSIPSFSVSAFTAAATAWVNEFDFQKPKNASFLTTPASVGALMPATASVAASVASSVAASVASSVAASVASSVAASVASSVAASLAASLLTASVAGASAALVAAGAELSADVVSSSSPHAAARLTTPITMTVSHAHHLLFRPIIRSPPLRVVPHCCPRSRRPAGRRARGAARR